MICPKCDFEMVLTERGWICPECGYRQPIGFLIIDAIPKETEAKEVTAHEIK